MKTLAQFLKEQLMLPQGGLNLPRDSLPQIFQSDRGKFMSWIQSEHQISHDIDDHYPVGILKPSQGDFDETKIEKMLGKDLDRTKPILVSQDGYVMDGHHRWIAAVNDGDKTIKVIVFYCDIGTLINLAKEFTRNDTIRKAGS